MGVGLSAKPKSLYLGRFLVDNIEFLESSVTILCRRSIYPTFNHCPRPSFGDEIDLDMPPISPSFPIGELLSRNITAANGTSPGLRVVCAWPVSGQYGPGSRVL